MKIVCSKDCLMEGINIVQKAVSTKTTMTILEGILIEASDRFKLTGNDKEIGIECFVEADILAEGKIVINSKMFGDIIRRMPNSEISLEVKNDNLVVIECENSHFEVKGLSASGFPAIPSVETEKVIEINQKVLRDMIKQTLFAVSIDENRLILTGSLMERKGSDLTVVSIDGFRLALRNTVIDSDSPDFSVVIPGKTLNEIVKILQPEENNISIISSQNQILFDLGHCKVVSRLLEGEYLNYRSVIPNETDTKIRINTKEFLASIERASLITADEKKYPVKFSVGDEKLVISSSTEVGAVREEIRVEMTGNKLEIGFNPKYYIDALKVIEEEVVDIHFTSSLGPCNIRPIDNDKFIHMILPVRIKND